eukprot:PhM_4_TR417/c3_g4_i1/m.48441
MLRSVPLRARTAFANVLAATMNGCNYESPEGWFRLLALPRLVLFAPAKGSSYAGEVSRRCLLFAREQYATLWAEAALATIPANTASAEDHCDDDPAPYPKGTDDIALGVAPDSADVRRKAEEFARHGQYRRALQCFSVSPCLPPSPTVLEQLHALHPDAGEQVAETRREAHPLSGVGARDAFKVLSTFPRGSSPGPSLLTARHLRETMRIGPVA